MAPTNRLIEARRAELRAEANAEKQRGAKTPATGSLKRRAPPKTRTKSKA